MSTAIAQIRFRRGNAAEWTGVNPVLGSGEPGVELDTGKMKIGDGARRWNDLPYTAEKGDPGPPAAADDDSVLRLLQDPASQTYQELDQMITDRAGTGGAPTNVDGGTP